MSLNPDTVRARFLAGSDTYDIARRMNVSEAYVSRLLWIARCRAMDLPAEYLDRARTVRSVAVTQAA